MRTPFPAPLVFQALFACAGPPEVEVTVTDDGDVSKDATAVWRIAEDSAPDMRFEGTGLLGVPANGVWSAYAVVVTEQGSTAPSDWQITVRIDMDSLETGIPRLDEHIRTDDFLDVPNHPQATFVSTAITEDGPGHTVTGDLTVRGTTREVSWTTLLDRTGDTLRTQASMTLSRWDFGLYADDVSEPGGDGASDEVTFTYDVMLTRQAVE